MIKVIEIIDDKKLNQFIHQFISILESGGKNLVVKPAGQSRNDFNMHDPRHAMTKHIRYDMARAA
jgi:hypothetical protein